MFTSLVSFEDIKNHSGNDEQSNYSNVEQFSFNFTNSESLNFSYSISVNNIVNTVQAFQLHYFDIELGNLITNKIATLQKDIVHFPYNFTTFKKLFPFHYYS